MDFGQRKTASISKVVGLTVAAIVGWAMVSGDVSAAVTLGGPSHAENHYAINFNTVGVSNPTYNFPAVPNAGDLSVSFGTHFVGQTFGAMHNSLSDTSPSNPLTLAHVAGTMVRTMFDLSHPSGPVLGGVQGNTFYTTPLAILFSKAVNYVSFELGHLDADSSTLVQAFDAKGNSLGVFGGLPFGFSTITLAESAPTNTIAGVSVYVPNDGMDWEGFGISNIKFGLDDGKVNPDGDPQVPEPATWIVWSLLGSAVLSSAWYSRRR